MIEFFALYAMQIVNWYLVGYLVALVINLVLAGVNDEDPQGIVWATKSYPLDIMYLIGVLITIIKNKGKK